MLRLGLAVAVVFLLVLLLPAAALWGSKAWVDRRYGSAILTPEQAPSAPVAIVFGAGLRWNGTPSPVLHDRVATAVQLYQQGTVGELLMSGSKFSEGYDEPAAMRALALEMGVPTTAILTDPGGTRTLASCSRAISEFGIRKALLVSQAYHLPRALATCDGLGLSAVGIVADLRPYHPRAVRFWETRELPATLVALVETRLMRKN